MVHHQRPALPINYLRISKPLPEVADTFLGRVDRLALAVRRRALHPIHVNGFVLLHLRHRLLVVARHHHAVSRQLATDLPQDVRHVVLIQLLALEEAQAAQELADHPHQRLDVGGEGRPVLCDVGERLLGQQHLDELFGEHIRVLLVGANEVLGVVVELCGETLFLGQPAQAIHAAQLGIELIGLAHEVRAKQVAQPEVPHELMEDGRFQRIAVGEVVADKIHRSLVHGAESVGGVSALHLRLFLGLDWEIVEALDQHGHRRRLILLAELVDDLLGFVSRDGTVARLAAHERRRAVVLAFGGELGSQLAEAGLLLLVLLSLGEWLLKLALENRKGFLRFLELALHGAHVHGAADVAGQACHAALNPFCAELPHLRRLNVARLFQGLPLGQQSPDHAPVVTRNEGAELHAIVGADHLLFFALGQHVVHAGGNGGASHGAA